jgi:hypothetical protein
LITFNFPFKTLKKPKNSDAELSMFTNSLKTLISKKTQKFHPKAHRIFFDILNNFKLIMENSSQYNGFEEYFKAIISKRIMRYGLRSCRHSLNNMDEEEEANYWENYNQN